MGTENKLKEKRGIKVYPRNLPPGIKELIRNEKEAYERENDRHCSYERAVYRLLSKLNNQ